MYNFIIYDFPKINRKRTNRPLMWSVVCSLLLTMHFGFAMPNTEMGILGDPCSQKTEGDASLDTFLTIGFGPFFGQRVAFDIPLQQGTTFEIKTIKIKVVSLNVPTFDVILYDDNAGIPGNVIESYNNVSISNSTLINTLNYGGDPVEYREYTLNISSENLVLNAPTNDTKYWMEIDSDTTGFLAWETTENLQIGVPYAFKNNFMNDWIISYENIDCVYELIGECTGCWSPLSGSFTQNSLTNVTLNWMAGTTNLYDVEWGEAGFTQGTGAMINGITGTFSPPITTVSEQFYEFYVRTDCDSGVLGSWSGPFSFKSGYCKENLYMDGCQGNTSSKIENVEITGGLVDLYNYTGYMTCDDIYNDYTGLLLVAVADTSLSLKVVNGGVFDTNVKAWADWNGDGFFDDTTELVAQGNAYYTPLTTNIEIPSDVLPGDYRLRIRLIRNMGTNFDFDACSMEFMGEIEDYTLKIIAPPTCMSPTNLGITALSPTTATLTWTSSATDFIIEYGLEGFTPGSGTIITTNNNPHTITGLTPNTNYEFYVTNNCGNNDLSLQVGAYKFYTGYCQATSEYAFDHIQSFTTTDGIPFNISNIDNGTSYETNGYSDFNTMVVSSYEGASVDFELKTSLSFSPNVGLGLKIWIDWNSNMLFEPTEEIYSLELTTNTLQGTITVPAGQPLGDYRIRIRYSSNSPDNITSCNYLLNGETEDYTFRVIPDPATLTCQNPPTNLGYNPVSDTDVQLTWTAGETGATHEIKWGVVGFNPDNTGTSVPNLDESHILTGLDSSVAYHFFVRRDCGSGDYSLWTGPFQFNSGYCLGSSATSIPIVQFSTTEAITNITYSNNNVPNPNGYTNFTTDQDWIIEHQQGDQFNFTLGFMPNANLRIWIDWNNDFVFDDTEEVFSGNGGISGNHSGTIAIPGNTPIGDYRMRIRASGGQIYSPIPLACGKIDGGETLDFTLKVLETPPCSGMPNAGSIAVNPSENQASSLYNVTATGHTVAAGLTYIWESNTNGTGWVEEYTGAFYQNLNNQIAPAGLGSTVQYRLKVACGMDEAISDIATFTTAYCKPVNTFNSDHIPAFSTMGALIDIKYTAAGQTGINGYNDLSSDASHTITHVLDGSFDFSHTYSDNFDGHALRIWIDWNKDSVFDDSEEVYFGYINTGSYVQTGTITIPTSTPIGNYRMRMRSTNGTPAATGFGTLDACSTRNYGQTLDFTLTIIDMPSCMPVVALSVSDATFTSVNVGWTAGSSETLWDIQWGTGNFNPATNTGTSVGNASGLTTPNYSITGLTPDTDYKIFVRADCGFGDTSLWRSINFFSAYCLPTSVFNSGGITKFVTTKGVTENISDEDSEYSTGGYGDFTYMVVDFSEGGEDINFQITSTGPTGIKIWIDWNKDLIFDEDETVYTSPSQQLGSPFQGSIVMPVGQAPGDYRMRVRTEFFDFPKPCGESIYGETKDYTFRVGQPLSCMPVTSPTATNISVNSAILQWTSDGNIFDIEYGEAGFTQGNGTLITEISNNYILSGLTTNMQYDYYVRQNCGSGDVSFWRGPISFTTGNHNAKVPSMYNTDPQVTDVACGSTYSIDVPVGKQIANLKVEYTMTSVNPRFISEQRSVLYSSTLGIGEANVVSGNSSDNFPGVQPYSRFLDFANGATGTVEFELKAWRVAGNPNCTDNEIFVVDGTWILTPTFEDIPACPNPPTNLGYTVISDTDVELFWTAGEIGAMHQLKWDVVGFNPDTNGTSVPNLTENSYNLTNLDSSISYEFYVRRDCGSGDFSTWTGPFRFNSGYCIPTSGLTYHFTVFNTSGGLQNVSYTGTAGGSGYSNNIDDVDLQIQQKHGESFDFTANYIGGANGLRIWVDWNNDFMFDDTEQVFYEGSANGNKSGTINVPLNTITGDYRMRVRAEQGASSVPPACGQIGFGEALDFILKVDGIVSVADFHSYSFKYYPNPVNDVLYFSSNTAIENVLVTNMLGQQINVSVSSDKTNVDLSNLPTGNYLVKITIEGVAKTIKVIKN